MHELRNQDTRFCWTTVQLPEMRLGGELGVAVPRYFRARRVPLGLEALSERATRKTASPRFFGDAARFGEWRQHPEFDIREQDLGRKVGQFPSNSCSAQFSCPSPTFSGAHGSEMRFRPPVRTQPSASPLPHGPVVPARRSRHASWPPENSFPRAGLQRSPPSGSRSAPRNRPPPCELPRSTHARCGT